MEERATPPRSPELISEARALELHDLVVRQRADASNTGDVNVPAADVVHLLRTVERLYRNLRRLDGAVCRACGCTKHNACRVGGGGGGGCGWAEPDLCTACAPSAEADARAEDEHASGRVLAAEALRMLRRMFSGGPVASADDEARFHRAVHAWMRAGCPPVSEPPAECR